MAVSGALRQLGIALATFGIVAFLFQGVPSTATAAYRTSLDAAASASPGRLSVEGGLASGNKGVPDATVSILLDGNEIASTTTDANGRFQSSSDVPSGTSGRTRVIVLFAGNEEYAPSQKSLYVKLEPKQDPSPEPTRTTSTPRPTPTQGPTDTPPPTQQPTHTQQPTESQTPSGTTPPTPPTPPTQDRAATSLTLSVDPSGAYPGDVLTLTGTLSSTSGKVSGVPIHFLIAGAEQMDSLVTTNSGGHFTTFLEVPLDLKAGRVTVEVVYNGSSTLLGTSRTARVEIKQASAEGTPTPEATTAAPDPSPDPTTAPEETATESTLPVPEDTTPATPPANWGWFVVTVIATGGVALLTVVGLLLRRFTARTQGEDDSFELLGPDVGP